MLIHFKVAMDGRMKILVVEVSKRKCFTGTFKAKSGVTIVATNTLNIKKTRWLHLECIHELEMSHNIEDSLSSSFVFSRNPHM